MTPGQIVSIIVATIVSATIVVLTINQNKYVPAIVDNNNDDEKRESSNDENDNQTFSFQEIIKETINQN